MKNIAYGLLATAIVAVVMACGWRTSESINTAAPRLSNSAPAPAANGATVKTVDAAKKAYRIEGTIDDANQEGNVCDTSVKFTVSGTLEFEFTPTGPSKGNYTYSGPFNATGSGPYEISDDGTMIVDGTGCIMGRCAAYSHKWKATPIDAATCKPGK